MELYELTAHELADKLRKREVSSREATESVFARIEQVEPALHAYLMLLRDLALEQADRADAMLAAGDGVAPLTGVPIALKDILCTRGYETTCASRILKGFVPPYDAHVIERMAEAGMVFVGKTNMDEFAMGSSTENSGFGPTSNPWDLDRVPGGSSGGSAAAVAADECVLAIGTDTGGSIRQPASFCGVVGMKPTYGRVSRYGLVAFASSLDQIGPITKDVTDCALLLNVIAGHDPRDATCAPEPVPDYTAALIPDVRGLRIGIAQEFFEYQGQRVSEPTERAVMQAVETLKGLGAAVGEVAMSHLDYNVPVYYLIAPAEASSNLARYDGVQYGHRTSKPAEDIIDMFEKTRDEGFGPEVKRRIMLGTYALSAGYYDAYYLKAQQVRTLIRRDFQAAFEQFDVLVAPTSPGPAFRLGERTDDPIQMYLSDVCTISVNLAGLPGMSLPCGSDDGLPIGEGHRQRRTQQRRPDVGIAVAIAPARIVGIVGALRRDLLERPPQVLDQPRLILDGRHPAGRARDEDGCRARAQAGVLDLIGYLPGDVDDVGISLGGETELLTDNRHADLLAPHRPFAHWTTDRLPLLSLSGVARRRWKSVACSKA